MLLVLDTDHVSILEERNQPACDQLSARLRQHPRNDVHTSIITFQERLQGWLAYLNKAGTPAQIGLAYAKLDGILRNFQALKVLLFDHTAQGRFAELQQQRLRIGTLDLRIASIALAVGGTLLSRNLRDFRRVPGLIVEDWTR